MDSSYKALARPGYLLALLFIIVPIADAVMSVWPLRFAEEQWRFGAVGAFSNITLVPLLGLFLGVAIAITLDHRRIRKFIGWFSALIALFFGIVLVIFILDYFQTRASVGAQLRTAMDVATYISMCKQVFTILTLTLLSGAGLRGPKALSTKRAKATKSESDASATPLIPLSGAARSE